jgi:hypothetical protein
MRLFVCLLCLTGCPPEDDKKKPVTDMAGAADLAGAGAPELGTLTDSFGIFCTIDGVATELRHKDYQGAGNTYEVQYSNGGWTMFLRVPINGSDTCNGATSSAIHLVRYVGSDDQLWLSEYVSPPAGPANGECSYTVHQAYVAGGAGVFEATFSGRLVRADASTTQAEVRLTSCTVRDPYYF